MSLQVTLYRFRIELSDIDRHVYETLDFRAAQHPSETIPYLLTRVLAFALNTTPDSFYPLQFSPAGLHDPDQPAISLPDKNGGTQLWVEIGNPSAKKLHKAAKAAQAVKVYTYKDPLVLIKEINEQPVHRSAEIEIYSFPASFLSQIARGLGRDNSWTLIRQDGSLSVTQENSSAHCELIRHPLLGTPPT